MLKWFGPNESEAKSAYRQFLKKGIDKGRRPDLVGAGLTRSQGNKWDIYDFMLLSIGIGLQEHFEIIDKTFKIYVKQENDK